MLPFMDEIYVEPETDHDQDEAFYTVSELEIPGVTINNKPVYRTETD